MMSPINAKSIAGAAAPLSLNPADYPACVAWFQGNEGTGAVVTDKMGNIADVDIVQGASADPWSVTRAFTANDDTVATTEVAAYRDLTAGDLTHLALGATEKLIIELDVLLPNYPAHSMAFFEFGQSETGNKGYMAAVDSNGKPFMRLSNDLLPWVGPATWASSGTPHAAIGTGDRKRVIFTIDNEAEQIRFYTSGVQNGTPVDTGGDYQWEPITPKITANCRVAMGLRFTGSRRGDCQFHNVRIWKPSSLDNIMQFVNETHRLTSDEFPPCMLGVE